MTMRRLRGERGSVLVGGLLLTLALLLCVGTSVDLGRVLIARRELIAQADQAALSGAQQIDLAALHQGRLTLDPGAARETAAQTLAGEHLTARIEASGESVQVRLRRTLVTVFLPLLGIRTLTIAAAATASPRQP